MNILCELLRPAKDDLETQISYVLAHKTTCNKSCKAFFETKEMVAAKKHYYECQDKLCKFCFCGRATFLRLEESVMNRYTMSKIHLNTFYGLRNAWPLLNESTIPLFEKIFKDAATEIYEKWIVKIDPKLHKWYKKEAPKKESSVLSRDACGVCEEKFKEDNMYALFCGHLLCRECLDKVQKNECPFCRANIILSIRLFS